MKTSIFPVILKISLLVLLLVSATGSVSAAPVAAAPELGGCQVFPEDNYWNTPIDNLPVHPASDEWVNTIGRTRNFHMDFDSVLWDGGPIGIPYDIVAGNSITKSSVDFYYPDESDPGPYPIPANPSIEWGSDHHILLVDSDECNLYEIYDAWKEGSQWYGGSGAIWDLNSNALRPDTWTSADAAGLPILPGLARYEEVAAGVIRHALRFTTNCTANYYIWPARHKAQSGSCTNPVPFGARFRLKAEFDISGYSPQAQVILQAMKTYGIVLADNGSPWYVSGAPNAGWDNNQLRELKNLTGNNFEAVNTLALMVDYDSAEASNTVNSPAQTVFYSQGGKDGWVLESTEKSNKGGTKNSTASTLRLGDDSQNRQYRSVLHFDTSSLPDSAIIHSVTLRIKRKSGVGTTPFKTHGSLLVDIRRPMFGSAASLQLTDFQAPAGRSAVGTFSKSPQQGWYHAALKSISQTYINRTGATQLRLRFNKDDNNDFGADYLSLYSGNAAASNRPQLIVEYYAP
jgi:hypothetical protein